MQTVSYQYLENKTETIRSRNLAKTTMFSENNCNLHLISKVKIIIILVNGALGASYFSYGKIAKITKMA